MSDHYTYPGTEVLVNIPGYHDRELWKAAERRVVTTHMADLALHPIDGDFDLSHLQAIHARLVEGFYAWGGRLRDTNTGPGGTGIAHCVPEFIPDEASRVFGALDRMDYLRGRDRAGFSAGLAWTWGEVTAIHPFRDVNTRSQFVFFNQLAASAGWLIDWNQIDPHVFAHARTRAIALSEDGIEALLHPALVPARGVDGEDIRARMLRAATEFTRPRVARERDVLDRELRAVLQRRANRLDPDPPYSAPLDHGPGAQDRGLGL